MSEYKFKFKRNHYALEIEAYKRDAKEPPKEEEVTKAVMAEYPWCNPDTLPSQDYINLSYDINYRWNAMCDFRMPFPWEE